MEAPTYTNSARGPFQLSWAFRAHYWSPEGRRWWPYGYPETLERAEQVCLKLRSAGFPATVRMESPWK